MTRVFAAIALALVGASMGAVPASAQFTVPTVVCHDRHCDSAPVRYEGAETSVILDHDDVETDTVISVVRTELQALDVRIPKPPYGVTGAGHCRLRFSVEATGAVSDLVVSRCPPAYAAHIEDSSADWRYRPLVGPDGTPRRVRGVTMVVGWQSEQTSVTHYE